MRYPGVGIGSVPGAKLLGTYEAELHGVVTRLVDGRFDVVINVGAGEGYYAVGLLTRMPTARGVAFEADKRAPALIREMAGLNGLADRLEVRGRCTPEGLVAAIAGASGPVVVMDVEGAEAELLGPMACPVVRRAAILVEVHEYLRPGITDQLLRWYTGTHVIERIPTAGAGSFPLPAVPGFSRSQIKLLADEMRPVMEWFWMLPRAGRTEKGRSLA
jgi:hypothetical protein